jgi:hypothetical protein
VILIFITLDLLFGRWRIALDGEHVSVNRSLLFYDWSARISAANVQDVRVAIGMTSGRQAYYDVKLVAGGRDITAGKYIRKKHEAEWIASRIRQRLGIGNT